MKKTAMTDFHQAIGQDVLEKPAEQLHDVKGHSTWARTANFSVGAGDRAVLEADDTSVRDGDSEDIGGEGGEGGVAVGLRLTMDIPGDGPDLRGDALQEPGLAPLFFEERTGDGGERLDRDKAVGSGGAPGRAVLGEATTRDNVVDVGMVLQLPAPGMQDPGEPRKGCPDEALICG